MLAFRIESNSEVSGEDSSSEGRLVPLLAKVENVRKKLISRRVFLERAEGEGEEEEEGGRARQNGMEEAEEGGGKEKSDKGIEGGCMIARFFSNKSQRGIEIFGFVFLQISLPLNLFPIAVCAILEKQLEEEEKAEDEQE